MFLDEDMANMPASDATSDTTGAEETHEETPATEEAPASEEVTE